MILHRTGKAISIYAEMIKWEHTIFALPFAFLGAFLAKQFSVEQFPTIAEIFWVFLAMFAARSAAFGLNRIFDRKYDAKNPRTANRAIPAGLLSVQAVWIFSLISLGLMLFAASFLNPVALWASPIAVFFLVIYSLTKRFTWLCHFVLGVTIALAPLGGWLAITGELPVASWILFVLVATWIAGFDILYATQDEGFDREERLFSIPARFGIKNALLIAKWVHATTVICLLLLSFLTPLGGYYLIGAIISAIILFYEHSMLKPHDMSRLQVAFFNMNGLISVILFIFTTIDLAVNGHGTFF